MALAKAALSAGRSPVDAPMRVMWPVPSRSSSRARSGEKASSATRRVDHTQPSWASFSSSVMRSRRSSTRASIGAAESR